jgi:hypothetical protein
MSWGLTLPTTTTFNITSMYIILTLRVLFVAVSFNEVAFVVPTLVYGSRWVTHQLTDLRTVYGTVHDHSTIYTYIDTL